MIRLTVFGLALCMGLSACAPSRPAPVETREPGRANPVRPPVVASRQSYRVKKGDSLYGIAWLHRLDFRQLAAWNGIRPPYRIYPNQKLRLMPPPVRKKPPVTIAHAKTQTPKPPPRATAKPPRAVPTAPLRAVTPKPQPAPSAPKPPRHLPKHNGSPPVQASAVAKPAKPAAPPPRETDGRLRWTWPTKGKLVRTFQAGDRMRQGIRIAGTPGQPIVAVESGHVVYSGSGLPGYGKLIIIKHNKNYLSAYGFNRKLLVRDGDKVTRGERVAEMGRPAGGKPLLHFEIRRSDKVLDPLRLLPRL